MLNKDLGRWMTPDPYGQFHSPYLAMGNNPVSNVDPNGGWVSIADLDPGHPFFYLVDIHKRYANVEMTKELAMAYANEMKQYELRLQQWLFERAVEERRMLDVLIQNHPENFAGLNPNEESRVASRMKELNFMIESSAKYLQVHAGKDNPPKSDAVSMSAWHAKINGNYYNRKAEQREAGIGLWYFNAGSVIPYRSAEEAYKASIYVDAKESGVDQFNFNFEYDIDGNIIGFKLSWIEAVTKVTEASTRSPEKTEIVNEPFSLEFGIDAVGNTGGGMSVLEGTQLALDAVGLIPGPGEIADLINAGIYAYNGDYINAGISMAGTVPLLGAAATGTRLAAKVYTKSNMKLGQEMHAAYKLGDVVDGVAFKEFRGIPGIRPDFVDFSTKTIYELKPFNPRSINAGQKQLLKYKGAFETKYPGTTWNTVLDTY